MTEGRLNRRRFLQRLGWTALALPAATVMGKVGEWELLASPRDYGGFLVRRLPKGKPNLSGLKPAWIAPTASVSAPSTNPRAGCTMPHDSSSVRRAASSTKSCSRRTMLQNSPGKPTRKNTEEKPIHSFQDCPHLIT